MPIVNVGGVGQVNFPDTMTPEEIKEAIERDILPQFPELLAKQSRTIGETVTDIGASFGTGVGSLAQIPGQVAGLITGDVDETTGLQGLGKRLETFAEKAKSPVLRAKEQLRSQKIAEAEGPLAEAAVAISQTLTDPALITSFLFEQVPNLIGTMGGGLLTKGGVNLLMRNATEEALAKSGTRGAVGTGSIMQGADIGTDTYENVYNELISQGMAPEEASKEALIRGRTAAIQAAALTVGTSFGAGSTIERALTRGMAGAPRRGVIRGTLGETLSEGIEEGGGQLFSNIQLQGVAPETDILKGVGAAAGLGAIGGALFGLPASFVNRANANEIDRARRQVEEARRRAEENNQPQEVQLALGFDPNVQGSGVYTPIIVNPDGTTIFPSERNQFAQVVPDELSEEGMAEKYGIPTAAQLKSRTFDADAIRALGISPKANIYKNADVVGSDIGDPAQAAKVKAELQKYLSKYPNVNPEIRKKIMDYLARPEFQPKPTFPTEITSASTTAEADREALRQRMIEGFKNRPEIKKIYEDYAKITEGKDAEKAALSAFNNIVTPQVIKSFGFKPDSQVFSDPDLINADLSNPETADMVRAKLLAIKEQTRSPSIKDNIDKYLNRSEFITPKFVDEYLNPPLDQDVQGLDHFVFTDADGNIQSKYGTVYEKNGKRYAKYAENKSQRGGERELSENVFVNPNPDQIKLLGLYKARDKIIKEPDDFKNFLMKYGIKPSERADVGLEKKIPNKMFRNNGYGLDDLMLIAIEDGLLAETDFQDGYGGMESMREYVRRALDGEFVPTMNNTRNMMDIESIQSEIEEIERRLKGVPEEAIAEEFRGEQAPEVIEDDAPPTPPPPTPPVPPAPPSAPVSDEIQLYEYQLGINAAMMDSAPNPNIVSKAAVDKLIANNLVRQDPDGTLHLLPKGNALLNDIRQFSKLNEKAKTPEAQEALFAKYIVPSEEAPKPAIKTPKPTIDELPELDTTGLRVPRGRNPQVVAAGNLFQQGKMSREMFNKYVDKFTPIAEVPSDVIRPPTAFENILNFFTSKGEAFKNRVLRKIPNGTRVGLRMDLPALQSGIPVVSIHEGKPNTNPRTGKPYAAAGDVIKYDSAAYIKGNVEFAPRDQDKSLQMGLNPEKNPLQTIEGDFVNLDPSEIFKRVKELEGTPGWTQVSFDPARHGYFYDRSNGEPVISATEVYQVGNFVLAKDVKYGQKSQFLYDISKTPYADKFIADAEKLSKSIRSALDQMGLKDVAVNFEDAIMRRINGEMTRVNGEYFDKLIGLSLSGDNIFRTMNHEAIHAMRDLGFFTDAQWSLLTEKAKKEWMAKYKITGKEGRYNNETEEVQIEEAIADAFADMQTQPANIKSLMSKIINILKRIGNVLRGKGYQTTEDIFGKAAAGKLKGTDVSVKGVPKASISTKDENFKRWFAGSKVVNKDGSPRVMYHGTPEDINAFLPNQFFAYSPEDANTYAFKNSFRNEQAPNEESEDIKGANLIPVYINAKKIATPDDVMNLVKKMGYYNDRELDSFLYTSTYDDSYANRAKKVIAELKKQGFDAIQHNDFDLKGESINSLQVFAPNQIKSAVGNTGQYNEKTSDIRYEKRARYEKMKASFEGMDEAYADAIKKQFTKEEATVGQKFENLKDNFFERMVTGIFDEFRAIKKYSTEAYMLARMSKAIDGGLQGLLEHGQVFINDGALDIRPNTKGLLEILEPLGTEVDQYQIWKALSRDAQMSADKRSLPEDLVRGRDNLTKGTLNGKSRKEIYEKARQEENQLNKSVLDVALQSGLIDRQAYQVFSNDINYIPFYKAMEDGDVDSINASSKLTGQYFSKALKGGEKKTNDLMENVLLNWSHILSASMKNQAAFKTLEAAESMNAAKRAKPMDGKYPPNTVKVMEEGKTVHYTLSDPDLVDAISTISYLGPKSAFLDVARGFTNALRYGVTMSPAYKIRNLIRDSMQSAAVSEVGFNMLDNIYNGLKLSDKGDPTFMSALAGGGIFEMGTAHEGNQARLIKRLIDKGVRETTILDTPEKIKGKLQDLLDAYNDLGNKFENANRLTLYKKLRDSGKTHLEASFAARDLMDFSMQGQFRAVKIIASVVPFFNARLQGLYKLGRDGITPTYRVISNATTGAELQIDDKQKAQRFMVMSSAVSLASILLYGIYKDDEDYQRREDWDRDNFWWFKIGETAFRVPKPFEIGAFGTIAERTYEQIADENVEGKVFADRLNHILMETFGLNPVPQMIKPLIDLYANKDSFTSAPIESAGMERLSKQERKTNNTSGIAIALGGVSEGAAKILTFNPDAQGFSPVQMDYAIKAYLGWLGATAVSTADLAVEPFTEGTRVRKPVIDTLAMGFVKTQPETQSKYMTKFYENNARLQSALADMRHYAEIGDMDKLAQTLEEKGDKIALSKVYDKASKQLATLRKQSRMIERSTDISTGDKRDEMNRIRILMSDIAKEMEMVRKSL